MDRKPEEQGGAKAGAPEQTEIILDVPVLQILQRTTWDLHAIHFLAPPRTAKENKNYPKSELQLSYTAAHSSTFL